MQSTKDNQQAANKSSWRQVLSLRLISFVLISIIFTSCAVSSRQSTEEKLEVKENNKQASISKKEQGVVFEQGLASYYGKRFHGRKTASGERFNAEGYTAAHKTLPFGTVVRVENVKNGKSIVLRINDRGPFVKGRIIDVSKMAARKLGFLDTGLTTVKIYIIS